MSFGILMPETTIETCKSTDQNVADVPSGDLISRDTVLALINKAIYNTNNKEIQDYLFCGLRRDVHHLPSADTISIEEHQQIVTELKQSYTCDRPKGEWIDKGEWIAVEDDCENIYWECSNCEDAFYLEVGTPKSNNYNYCPNCGADMRGDKDD